MIVLPAPRNIRRNWHREKDPTRSVALVLERFPFLDGRGGVAEARGWRVTRGNKRGSLKRVDILFIDGSSASVRIGERNFLLKLGTDVCR